ncbi:IS66 family transposase, partial [Planctomycetota bacterium]
MSRRRKGKPRPRAKQPKRREVRVEQFDAMLKRAQAGPLSTADLTMLREALDTLTFLTRELEAKGASIRRLRRMLFGPSTEKTSRVVGGGDSESNADAESNTASGANTEGSEATETDTASPEPARGDATPPAKPKRKRKGHGRNGAAAYTGAEKVPVPHGSLEHKAHCPECNGGKVYLQGQPRVLVRVRGVAPLGATVYELERLRCNLCGEVFTAEAPAGLEGPKYDETAASMIGLIKYGCGLPFYRLEQLERDLGIPLPASTQWEVVARAAEHLEPPHQELVRQAAQGKVVHNDDTTMKILDLDRQAVQGAAAEEASGERVGVFTTGIVSTGAGHDIALFFTGRKHAGENLADVLTKRAADLPPPVQMCDALSCNTTGDFETTLAHCLAHARRRYVDVADSFPDECRRVLEELREVYHNDALARKRKLSPEERLRFHQTESRPVMKRLEKWLRAQLDERRVEPNSGLGGAIGYMLKHWEKLTLFLREPGAPLDNNICERILKKAILHRKAALFYKTENGARVGDIFMSLIHTAELCG